MKKILILLITISLTSCGSIAKYNSQITKTHSKVELQEDIDYAYHILKRNHPDLDEYLPQEQLDYKFDSLKQAIKPMNTHDFYFALNTVMKNIGQGHTTIGMPYKTYTKKERKARGKRKGFSNDYEFKAISNRLFITRAITKDSILKRTTEITQIDGQATKEILKKYQSWVTSDGYNTTFQPRVIGKRFWRFYAKDKGIVDSVKVQCQYKDSIFDYTFKVTYKKKGEKGEDDEKKAAEKDSLDSKKENGNDKIAQKALKTKHKIYKYSTKEKVYYRDFKFIGDTLNKPIALLKIRGFRAGKYKKAYNAIFSKIDSSKTENLIIDLRDNFGGSLNEISYLFSYLAKNDFQMVKKAKVTNRNGIFNMFFVNTSFITKAIGVLGSPAIAYISLAKISRADDGDLYFKYKVSKTQSPKENHFKGKIYVLINGNSFSASALLSTQLKATKRATFVGEETGGAYNSTVAGGFLHPELPNSKITMRFGLMNIKTPYIQKPLGHGVYPDIKLLPTVEDLQHNKDTELTWILEDIKKNNKSKSLSKKEKK
jgi:C-terminal processing protease CtpA/Prc